MSTENEVVEEQQLEDTNPGIVDDDFEVVIEETETDAEVEAPAEDEVDEPADEDAEEPTGESQSEEDAELASMPAKFKKRLTREIRLREQIIQEREQIKAQAVQVVNFAKQRDDEVTHLKKQNAALQRQFAETLDYAYERDITMKASELRKAREDGDYDVELKVQGELDQLRFQHNQVRQAKVNLPDPEKVVATQPAQQAPQQQQAPQHAPPAPQAVKWLERNKAWFANPKFAGHRAFALAEDLQLVREGYDKTSDEYYTELDRRVDEAFPSLRKKGKPTSSPVAPASSSPARNTPSNVVKLTKADLSNMRAFGLDPSNKEHLREYAKSKRAA